MTGESGARWRALKRFVLGKPGSIRRWVVGSLLWLIVVGFAVIVTGMFWFVGLAVLPVVAWAVLRTTLIGDEDELKAGFARTVVSEIRNPTVCEPRNVGIREDASDWLNRRPDRFAFDEIPPAPIAEESQPPSRVDS